MAWRDLERKRQAVKREKCSLKVSIRKYMIYLGLGQVETACAPGFHPVGITVTPWGQPVTECAPIPATGIGPIPTPSVPSIPAEQPPPVHEVEPVVIVGTRPAVQSWLIPIMIISAG